MAAPALTSLIIENLRGSVTPFKLDFVTGRKLTILYGQNGTGKSTVADAFDLLGNGTVGSLATRGLGSTRKFWPSVGKAAGDVKVALDTASGQCSVLLGNRDIIINNEPLRPQVEVLRRSQILQLVEAKPAERYQAISQFIDVSGVQASEDTLRRLIKAKKDEFETATTRVAENRSSIDNFWEEANKPGADAISWAKQEAKVDPNELDQRKASIDRLIVLWDAVVAHPQKIQPLTSAFEAALRAREQAQSDLDVLKDAATADYLEIVGLLKAAQAHFHTHPNPTRCPLCESSENVAGLVDEVDQRLRSQGLYQKLEAAKKVAAAKDTTVQQAQQSLDDARNSATEDAAVLSTWCNNGQAPADIDLPTRPTSADVTSWAAWISANENKRDEWSAASDACTTRKQFIATLNTLLAPLADNEKTAKALEALRPHLGKMLELIEAERKRFTGAILTAISVRVGELYETMHQDEGLNKIALELDAAKRASLEITASFGGRNDTPPQAYFSDSHLDTLGLCIFLALAERETPEDKILVLDDVLGSVDEPHVERVITTIYNVAQGFRHTIVTTHYGPWREKFRWGILKPDKDCHFVELNRWTLTRGITLTGGVIPEIARLKALLTDPNPDVQSITGKAGVILESLLDFVTLQYACAVPRKPGNTYVLGDLLGAVHGKLLTAMKAEIVAQGEVTQVIELKPLIDDIKAIAQARNVLGAHFSANAFELSPNEGIRFARLVERLCDALVCPVHGRPRKDTGSYWRNSGDTRRLHPLNKPS